MNDTSKYLVDHAKSGMLSMQAIHDHVRRRCFPFSPDLYSLLGMNKEDGLQNFADIILRCKREFEEYNRKVLVSLIECLDGKYKFKDNFFDYIDLKIPSSEVSIKPRTIIHFTTAFNFFSSVKASTFFRYDQGTGLFESTWSNVRVKYFIDYPFRANLNEAKDGFTEDSGIYFVEDKDQFLTLCCLRVMVQIQEYSKMITLPGFPVQVDLQLTIQELSEKVRADRERSSSLYAKWAL